MDFFGCLAARHSQMFDEIYWAFLDEAYFGKFTSIEDRAEQHLDENERSKLNDIYDIKMEQAKDGEIDSWYTVEDFMEL